MKDVHNFHNLTPFDADNLKNHDKVFDAFVEHYKSKMQYYKKPKYKIGDKVRLYRYRTIFEKHSVAKSYADEIFTIYKINYNHVPVTYYIRNENDEPIKGCVYEYELSKSNS